MNVKVLMLMLWVNETRFLVQHESCESKCISNENVCNWNQKWNRDKWWWECKELDDWIFCKKIYTWNPSKCDCICDEACRIGEYLDIKKIVDVKNVFFLN